METKKYVQIDNVKFMFKNFDCKHGFKGQPTKSPTVAVVIDNPQISDELFAAGWPIKTIPANPERGYEEPTSFMKTTLKFGPYPPKVFMLVDGVPAALNEHTIGCLQSANIQSADVVLNLYHSKDWNVDTVYVREMVVTVAPTVSLESKYSFMSQPESDIPSDDINAEDLPF